MSPIVDNFFTKKSPYGYIIVLGTLGIFATLFYKNTNKHSQKHVSSKHVSSEHVSVSQEPLSQVNKEDRYRETIGKQSGRRSGGKKSPNKTKKRK
jgi:LAS superfamily LD-carboxypeptidase LdcB